MPSKSWYQRPSVSDRSAEPYQVSLVINPNPSGIPTCKLKDKEVPPQEKKL